MLYWIPISLRAARVETEGIFLSKISVPQSHENIPSASGLYFRTYPLK